MKNFFKNITYIILILVGLSLILSISQTQEYSGIFSRPKDYVISLTRLARDINQGKIEKIKEQDLLLKIKYKDGVERIAYKERNSSLTETLINLGVEKEKLSQVDISSTGESFFKILVFGLLPILLPILILIWLFRSFFSSAQKGQIQAFNFIKTKAKLFKPGEKKERVTFGDIGGLEEVKEELKEIVDFLKNPDKYLKMGAKIPKGVLLIGAPGTGKTLIARAVANEAKVPFFYISASEFIELFVGVGASRVRSTFDLAKKNAPCLIFIDELDAIGRHRGAGIGGGHDEREQTLNQILVEMDGFDKDTKVIVIAATNRPDILDPALLRPGRFDRRIILPPPDLKAREQILKIHTKNKPLAKDVDLKTIAKRTPGFSGADLENLCNEAALLAARRNKKEISQSEFIESIEKVILGPERKSKVISEKEKKIAAYHESGHALVAHFHPHSDKVEKISIISRGIAGGYTLALPDEDRYFRSRKEFEGELAVALGGYVAEKLIFGDITTGAGEDLKKVTELARKIVMRYGMSESLAPMVYGKREELVFLGREIHEEKTYSEETAKKIDKEIEKIVKRSYKTAKDILEKHKKLLDKLAKTLIEKETLEKQEFLEIVKEEVN